MFLIFQLNSHHLLKFLLNPTLRLQARKFKGVAIFLLKKIFYSYLHGSTSVYTLCKVTIKKLQNIWQRIRDYFDQHKKFDADRNANSLMHRWSAIFNLVVNKFC